MSDPYKYTGMEHTLEIINREFIALPPEEVERNNIILHRLLDEIMEACSNSNKLFRQLFRKLFFGGSFYEGLKIRKPDEYDIHIKFYIPSSYSHAVISSGKNGYVHLKFLATENKSRKLWNKWRGIQRQYYGMYGLHVLVDDEGYLNTEKVMKWLHQILSTWLGDQKSKNSRGGWKNTAYGDLWIKFERHGPAFTFHVTNFDNIVLNFDFVPGFVFGKDQWPQGFRRNRISKKCEFYIIPKPPKGETIYWRTSFQEQDKDVLSGKERLKPAFRLIKQIRDKYRIHEIVSFFIKNVFLWAVLNREDEFWNLPLSYVFIKMLESLRKRILKGNIPYFWNANFNLIGHLDKETLYEISDTLKYIIDDIKYHSDNEILIAKHFLSRREMKHFKDCLKN